MNAANSDAIIMPSAPAGNSLPISIGYAASSPPSSLAIVPGINISEASPTNSHHQGRIT